MAEVLPRKINDRITYLETVLPDWSSSFAAIGLTEPQVDDMSGLVVAARNAFNAAEAARLESKMKTQDLHDKWNTMSEMAAALIVTIKAKAAATNNPNVLVLAGIPAPAPPSPAGVPPVPTDVRATLRNDGSIQIRWHGTTRAGTFFTVWRKLQGETKWTNLGAISSKTFIDDSLEGGCKYATYMVVAQRGTLESEGSEPVTVFFGTGEGGEEIPLAA